MEAVVDFFFQIIDYTYVQWGPTPGIFFYFNGQIREAFLAPILVWFDPPIFSYFLGPKWRL